MEKLIVILGPTASGKSALGVNLARLFNGEIISADSRQVYKGLDIGSGKITKSQMQGVPHYLLDVASPKRRFSVAQYQKLAFKTIKQIQQRGKLPFLVGGTGLYIQSIVDGTVFPEAKPNRALRAQLTKKSASELFAILKKLDPGRAATIDANNPRRLIRAIEIVKSTGKPVPTLRLRSGSLENQLDFLMIGIEKSPAQLKKLIAARLQKRIRKIIAEVKSLHTNGLSWKRLEELGLEYRFVARYLQGKISYEHMIQKIQIESLHFTKRQMTWFKRDTRIQWVDSYKKSQRLIENFVKK